MNEWQNLVDAIKSLTELDDETLNDNAVEAIKNNIDEQFSPEVVNQSINQMIKNLEDQELTRTDAKVAVDALTELIKETVYGENQFTGNKKIIVDYVLNKTLSLFEEALKKYHLYSIELPMVIAPEAKVPTYAHDTDAAADLYAMEDQVINAHSYGNMIRTGVKIQLPEGWMAMILPRSSIGAKTPLRLSNSVGLIDSGYRGELGVLYDNTSDEDYKINMGDRIAQLLVMPSHRFQAKVVDVLVDSDRGEGGFGASGK